MPAILFGSISTVSDTSELQRDAFNQAFQHHGLDWKWDRDEYLPMLESSGGEARIAEYAGLRGETVDAGAIHQTKSRIFQQTVGESGVTPRPGVVDTIRDAKSKGVKVGLVTTTSIDNISALLDALAPDVKSGDFDVIVDASSVQRPKPDKAAYEFAMRSVDEGPDSCVAIEDNIVGAAAAAAAGVACVAFPNENTAGHDFSTTERRVDRLDFDDLRQLTKRA